MKFATVGDNCIDDYAALGKRYPGGNAVNVAVYLRRLGENASYMGAIGDDENGKLIIDSLIDKGVDISHIKVLKGKTAVTKVKLVDGNRVFEDYDEGVLKDFKLSDDDIDYLCSHDIIISGIWGMIEDYLPRLKGCDIPIAFDFSDQLTHPVVDKAIEHVTYAFFSADQDSPEIRKYMKDMYDRGPKIVTVTLGENGSLSYDGKQYYKFGIVPCNVVDTMGAGDSYIAGFIRAIMHGKNIPVSMEEGAKNSSVTIEYQGAW